MKEIKRPVTTIKDNNFFESENEAMKLHPSADNVKCSKTNNYPIVQTRNSVCNVNSCKLAQQKENQKFFEKMLSEVQNRTCKHFEEKTSFNRIRKRNVWLIGKIIWNTRNCLRKFAKTLWIINLKIFVIYKRLCKFILFSRYNRWTESLTSKYRTLQCKVSTQRFRHLSHKPNLLMYAQ